MFETYVAQNLVSLIGSRWKEAELYFWSVQGRHEVDLIIEAGRNCPAIEAKSSARWEKKDCVAGILGHNGTEAVRLGEKIWALPLDLILS
jgi:uncharacterized protein